MSDDTPFKLPEITDDDIRHASQLLDLAPDAFYGPNGDDPRQNAIKRMDSVDVAACPGSGKTTLLVAKLAILAKNWSSSTRGICVLSHTNTARHEIEKYLGNTSEGQKLLGYPHYIGTIHGFVNEFLALPFLRSKGYDVKVIDTDICQKKRRSFLPPNITKRLISSRTGDPLHISVIDFEFNISDIPWGKGMLGNHTATYTKIVGACRKSSEQGYFCYEDMFLWAKALIENSPAVSSTLQDRFPILFIDEAQDNSKDQTDILSSIFMVDDSVVVRQRFGDANQAIYDFQGAKEATTDTFPGPNSIELQNSHRFGQKIASLADPLGLKPYGIKGVGPRYLLDSGLDNQDTIFLFDEVNASNVIGAYGDLILKVFSEDEINADWFKAYAVGSVHKPAKEEKEGQFPHDVKHYMAAYDHELNKPDPKPSTFLQYLSIGTSLSENKGETYPMVEKIAEALLRLASYGVEQKIIQNRRHKHRYIIDLLGQEPDQRFREKYLGLVNKLAVERYMPGKDEWRKKWCDPIKNLAQNIAGVDVFKPEADEFLKWNDELCFPPENGQLGKQKNNIFSHEKNSRKVPIKVGSIHSVKGQTHTATLVLEAFWHDHNIEKLLPWISNTTSGWKRKDGLRQENRLKSHYVAMTRPTHLLCLAIKRSSVNDEAMALLKSNGWKVCEISQAGQQTRL